MWKPRLAWSNCIERSSNHGGVHVGQLGHGLAGAKDPGLWPHEPGPQHAGGSHELAPEGPAQGQRRHRDPAAQPQPAGGSAQAAAAICQPEGTRSELQCHHLAAGCRLPAAAGHADRQEQPAEQWIAAQVVPLQAGQRRRVHAQGAQSERQPADPLPGAGHRAAPAQVPLCGRQQDLEHFEGYLEDAKVGNL